MKYLICKKNLIGFRIYRINQKYEIRTNGYREPNDGNCYVLTDEHSQDSIPIKGLWFGPHFAHTITDYFYTKQELRIIKLKQLKKK